MKIFVNSKNQICDVGSTTDSTLTEYVIDDNIFKGWSKAKICCYKIEQWYDSDLALIGRDCEEAS